MFTVIVLGLISLIWFASGLTMVVVPEQWRIWMRQALAEPVPRYLLTQGMILCGLLLMLGSAGQQAYLLWVVVGMVVVTKALVLLALRPPLRERLLGRYERYPLWVHRVAGVATVLLATYLAIDVIRGGS